MKSKALTTDSMNELLSDTDDTDHNVQVQLEPLRLTNHKQRTAVQ